VGPPRAFVEVARTARVLAEVPSSFAWLSDSERARLETLRHAGRREHYLAGHWLARALLARAFGDAAWSLLERRSLPPLVCDHEDSLFVSLSHSGDWVAAAVADAPVGIDIEQRGRVLDASVEALLLEPGEAREGVDADLLLQRWVAKEAWLKRAAGIALPEQLARVRLRAVPRGEAEVRIESHARLHLGVALATHCVSERRADVTLVEGVAFAVEA
jgi:4'-phosphopantetheinyl transferase